MCEYKRTKRRVYCIDVYIHIQRLIMTQGRGVRVVRRVAAWFPAVTRLVGKHFWLGGFLPIALSFAARGAGALTKTIALGLPHKLPLASKKSVIVSALRKTCTLRTFITITGRRCTSTITITGHLPTTITIRGPQCTIPISIKTIEHGLAIRWVNDIFELHLTTA